MTQLKTNLTDDQLEALWEELKTVSFKEIKNGKLVLEEDWRDWSAGTWNEDIWHWFDEHHSKGVVFLMYGK